MSNPVMLADPSGYVSCAPSKEDARSCAQKIVEFYRSERTDLEALAQLFVNRNLLLYPETGTSAKDRLKFILDFTGEYEGGLLNFKVDFGETGLREELQDGCFYDADGIHNPGDIGWEKWHRKPGYLSPTDPGLKTNQIGHFLSAVWIGRGIFGMQSHKTIDRFGNRWVLFDTANTIAAVQAGLGAVIGHELTSDANGQIRQIQVGTAYPFLAWLFLDAVADDLNGSISQRDKKLKQIFFYGGYTDQMGVFHQYTDDSTKWQQGNSLNDLRLSLKGFSFAAKIQYGTTVRREAADWLRKELG